MSKIEKLFYEIDNKVEKLKLDKDLSYFNALASYLSLENDEEYFNIVDNYTKDEIKKVYYFLILKGLKDIRDVNYNITPEIISIYISSIVQTIFGENKKLDILDLASGSGSLFLELLGKVSEDSNFNSVDVDYDYVRLQANIFNLLENEVTILNQDALKPLNVPKQDVVLSDVPLGYYVDDDNSLNFKLCSEAGHSFNSLLFLEQATNYLKDNGVAVLIMPKDIMHIDSKMKTFLEKDINFNAFIMLPEELFKNKEHQKVIVLVTKKGQNILPNQVFLAEISSFQNKQGYLNFFDNLNSWINSK